MADNHHLFDTNTRTRIVFLDRDTIPAHISISSPSFPHQWVSYPETELPDLVERIADADIIVTNKVSLSADDLSCAQKVKHIAVTATGVNNIDLAYCQSRGISVSNIQGYATRSVPEHVIALLFTLFRNLPAYHNDIAQGEWQKQGKFCFFTHPIQDVAGATLGIIGSGALGQATAKLASAIGMKVIFSERKNAPTTRQGYVDFETVLRQSDAVCLLCPLTELTQGLIAENELALMKSSAVLINTGRGGLVDEQALVEALIAGSIAGAGVDVFTQEPALPSNPLIANIHLPNLVLTPHVAWGSDSSIQRLCDILIENIDAFWQGKTTNHVV
ncbi:glycerate dehydrogenase [Vibrio sp. 10N.286.49.C2]|uniref:D-2-hydroxyacid dehydrogenase n=1 Tax=unclassified Vibrio TaxID=2614977 RepID=UPI000C82EAF1|nr:MULTISPECIES: D-2-hydroxyacid dehydrogenase [unclassified Vibrio]PMH27560.1 glycerate dehydrogenase [Vibrio sp. 10N.286.49.C2]PMH52985.1 glycerate dehydrogenase [Vibrio sp. 10N.286.49.B1]PMH79209.1 glycerate dehydrogenase [Vibrio sp. 10N.286.48.B7]